MADAAPAMIWIAEPDGTCSFLSRSWCEFTGQVETEALGLGWLAAVHPEDSAEARRLNLEAAGYQRDFSIHYRLRRADGEYRWVLDMARPRVDASGNFMGYIGSVVDVHERTMAEQSLLRAQAQLESELNDARMLHQISAAMILEDNVDALYESIVDAAVAVMRSDFASMQMLYPEPGQSLGGGGELHLLAHRGFTPAAARSWERVRADSKCTCGAALQTGQRVIAPDIETCAYVAGTSGLATYLDTGIHAVQSTPLRSRGGLVVGMISTHWKERHEPSERDLRLLDILARQAADVIERRLAEEALRNADRRKDEFLATLSHELRNPLAPICNAIQILKAKSPPIPELLWASDVIDRQVTQMARLVDDLLDVSRITSGKIELRRERVQLHAVLEDALEASRPHIERSGHTLTVVFAPDPIWLDGDPTRLAQVFLNLLNNAAKYTPRGGQISLVTECGPGEAVVRVRDNGIGIREEMLGRIFGMFTQSGPAGADPQAGLGIGLTLVERMVTMHGGRVAAHSEGPGRGSEFIVTLPIARPDDLHAQELGANSTHDIAAPLRILGVDDNLDAADSMAMFLGMTGHEVRTAHDGFAAVDEADAFRPRVVLLDIGLPKLNGYEAAQRMRAQGCDAVLIALTGWGQDEDRRRSREAGFDHHLTKPVVFEELNKLLATVSTPSDPAR